MSHYLRKAEIDTTTTQLSVRFVATELDTNALSIRTVENFFLPPIDFYPPTITSKYPVILVPSKNSIQSSPLENEQPLLCHRQILVDIMLTSLDYWEKNTQLTRIELAEQSGLWRVSIDDGRLRTRSFNRYLSLKSIPKNPRWQQVIKTANFVLSLGKLPINDSRILSDKINRFTAYKKYQALRQR
jgi:two-component system, sensor histidine kinase ChiS